MKHIEVRRLVMVLLSSGVIGTSGQVMASAFQIWEQDIVGVGNYHAGYAAEVNDASSAWYNPAGMTRLKNQQLVVGTSAISSNFKYKGSVGVTEVVNPPIPIPNPTISFSNVTANGGALSFVPNLEYVAPINDWMSFGFSAVAPFGLKTDYRKTTPLRFAATKTSIQVVDLSPSLAFKVTDKASLGLGFDAQIAEAEFNAVAPSIQPFTNAYNPAFDTLSQNKARDTGYGYHLGALYEFSPCTRVGVSYHSQVVHHFKGTSEFEGPIAQAITGFELLKSKNAKANVTLPAYTALSAFHQFNPSWAVMGSVIYTQWHVFETLKLQNAAGAIAAPPLVVPSTSIEVAIPEHYKNSWSASVGVNYYPTETITLRGGIGYDQTPVNNKYRNAQLPDKDRVGVALGGHFQATKTVGLDVGWTHIIFNEAKLNPPTQVNGALHIDTVGRVKGGADVLGAELTWDIV